MHSLVLKSAVLDAHPRAGMKALFPKRVLASYKV